MLVLLSLLLAARSIASNVSECSCGYRDDASGLIYTESIISYFNETGVDQNQFLEQSYTHHFEKSWNALYRQGASSKNVLPGNVTNTAALQLLVDPPKANHVVVGGGIRTSRRDILHGTFRAFVRSPPPLRNGGSVLTMAVQYDDIESVNINLMNTNDPSTAWLSTLMRGEFPTNALTIQYRDILAAAATNTSIGSPWNFVELRIDWLDNEVAYYVGGNLTRLERQRRDIPRTPSAFYLRHWSTGDRYTSQGPPSKRTIAEIGWGRLFFNSSLMTLQQHQAYDDVCRMVEPCSVNDWNLRGSSSYDEASLLPWEKVKPKLPKRIPAIVVSILSVAITVVLLSHAFVRRQPWRKRASGSQHSNDPYSRTPSIIFGTNEEELVPPATRDGAFRNSTTGFPVTPRSGSVYGTTLPPATPGSDSIYGEFPAITPASGSTYGITLSPPTFDPSTISLAGARFSRSQTLNERLRIDDCESIDTISPAPQVSNHRTMEEQRALEYQQALEHQKALEEEEDLKGGKKSRNSDSTIAKSKAPWIAVTLEQALGEEIGYLEGLVVICCIIIAIVDFALTFHPALIEPSGLSHYSSEVWARKVITPVLLSFIWVGPIITISSRYLAVAYLRNGNLQDIARKAVSQVPRLMIPVLVVTLIEYFSINAGITNSLKHLPSLSWSEWPYTSTFSNFANWITELIELAYLIPNAAPAITFHYCTGVLWLIPVLLQFSWTILLGVVVIREIKTPWKRSLYYAFALATNWYARSWGTFLWFGLLLADLDVVYDYKTKLSSRAFLSAAVSVTFLSLALLGGAADLLTEWTNYNFSDSENNIHPDISTALPLAQTDRAGYPPYYVPRLSALIFAAGIHGLVETCQPVQYLLTSKLVARLSPHALTIYLMHGLVFWSWGAWLAVKLAGTIGLPYWAVSLIVAVTSFTFIALSLPILTPVLSTLERSLSNLAWHAAITEPPTKRTTIFPFAQDLIQSYDEHDKKA